MVTKADIQTAIADQIRSLVDEVDNLDVQVEDRMVLNPTPPTIDIWPGDPSVDQSFASFGEPMGADIFTLRGRVSTADSRAGQDLLLALMDDEDPLSLAAALDSDQTLGGLTTSLDITNVTGFVLIPDTSSEGAHLGCLWAITVIKARS